MPLCGDCLFDYLFPLHGIFRLDCHKQLTAQSKLYIKTVFELEVFDCLSYKVH